MSEAADVHMSESLLSTLVGILDIVVLERLHGGSFRQIGTEHPPSWFTEAFHNADPGAPVTLVQAFPVLDSFLSDAEVFWQRMAYGRLDGEPFVLSGAGGQEVALVMTAVALQGRHFLFVQRVAGFDEQRRILQVARDKALDHEQVVRQIDALRRPVSKLTTLADELSQSSDLGAPHRALVGGMTAELNTVRQVLDALPKLPPATSARRR